MSQSDFTTANIAGSCRWTAPEVLDPPEEDEEKPLSAVLTRETDVYAFGMTVLEVIGVGSQPPIIQCTKIGCRFIRERNLFRTESMILRLSST